MSRLFTYPAKALMYGAGVPTLGLLKASPALALGLAPIALPAYMAIQRGNKSMNRLEPLDLRLSKISSVKTASESRFSSFRKERVAWTEKGRTGHHAGGSSAGLNGWGGHHRCAAFALVPDRIHRENT